MKCPNCATETNAKFCENCGTAIETAGEQTTATQQTTAAPMMQVSKKKPLFKKWWFWVIIVVVLIGIFNMPDSDKDETKETGGSASSISKIESNADSQSKIAETNKPVEKVEVPTATTGQKNALKKAKSYLEYTAFSYDGLIGQLEFEKFSKEEAVYGADNCRADWNAQAVAKAKNYLKNSAFSYEGLIGQLEFEKFTSEQAKHGADNCGADWKEQAVKKAASYLKISSFSRQKLIDQLIFEKFTQEQAEYGATQNGL